MTCPICGSELYEQNRNELTGGTFISIRCTKCNYYDYKTIPVNFNRGSTITTERTPRTITHTQAYEIALNTLRIYEDKWNAYVQEEAKLQSIFDEDDTNPEDSCENYEKR